MKWESVNNPPKFEGNMLKNILVWVADGEEHTFHRGKAWNYKDEIEFTADGHSGKWKITHWSYVDAPEDN